MSTAHEQNIFWFKAIIIDLSYKDNHKISDGFEIWPEQTLDCGVGCSWASGKSP